MLARLAPSVWCQNAAPSPRASQQQQPAFRFVGKFSVPDYTRKFAGEEVEDILDSLQLRLETALMQRILLAVFFGMGQVCLSMFKGKEI